MYIWLSTSRDSACLITPQLFYRCLLISTWKPCCSQGSALRLITHVFLLIMHRVWHRCVLFHSWRQEHHAVGMRILSFGNIEISSISDHASKITSVTHMYPLFKSTCSRACVSYLTTHFLFFKLNVYYFTTDWTSCRLIVDEFRLSHYDRFPYYQLESRRI